MAATQEAMILEATRRALVTTKSEIAGDLNKVHKAVVLRQSLLDERLNDARRTTDRLLSELDRLHDRVGALSGEQAEKTATLRTELVDAIANLMQQIEDMATRHDEVSGALAVTVKELQQAYASGVEDADNKLEATRLEIYEELAGLVDTSQRLEEAVTKVDSVVSSAASKLLAEVEEKLLPEIGEKAGNRLEVARLEIKKDISRLSETVDDLDQAMLGVGQTVASMEHRLRCELETKFQEHAQAVKPGILEEVSAIVDDSRRMLNEAISALQLDAFDDRLRSVAECQDELSIRADHQADDLNTHSNLLAAQADKINDLDDRTRDMLSDLTCTVRELASDISPWAQGGPAYRAQATVTHRGGVWLATRQTHDEPGAGDDWLLVMNGVNVCSIAPDPEDVTGCSYSFVVEDTAGNQIVSPATLPTPNFLKTWEPGRYGYMDSVIKDGHRWLCVVSYTADEPGKSNDWRLMAQRGARGRPGEKGDRGFPGEKGAPGPMPSMNKVLEHWLDFLQCDGGVPISRWMGQWAVNETYRQGDIVDYRGRPRLCLRDISAGIEPPDKAGQQSWVSMGSPPPASAPAARPDRMLIAREAHPEVIRGYAIAMPLDEKYSRIEFTLTTRGLSLEINAGKGDGAVYADVSLSKWDENNRVWHEVKSGDSAKIEWCDRGATSLQGHLIKVPGTDEWQGMVTGIHNANDDNVRPSAKARRISLNAMIGACPGEKGEPCQFGFGSAAGEQGRVYFEAWGILG